MLNGGTLIKRLAKLSLVFLMVFVARANAAPNLNKQEPVNSPELAVQTEVLQPTKEERPVEVEKPKQEEPKPQPKAEKKVVAKPSKKVVKPTPKPKPVAPKITGTKEQWMTAAGIPKSQWKYVDYIVSRESSWNPNAVNRSSGACGLGQQLPCGKWPGRWNDPVAALKAQYNYVTQRYGGYAGAYSFWTKNHWY